MGKLLIFVGIVIATVIVLGLWGYFLQNRQTAKRMQLTDSKQRIAALEARVEHQATVLEEIREIADSSEVVSGDPLWSRVLDMADQALAEEKKR